VEITLAMMERFGVTVQRDGSTYHVPARPYSAADYLIEPDASTASYFLAAAAVTGRSVTVPGLGSEALQGDLRFADILAQMGADVSMTADSVTVTGAADGRLNGVTVSMRDISDTMPTLAAIAPFANAPVRIEDVYNTRVKECDRLDACAEDLRALGVPVRMGRDWIEILPVPPAPAPIACRGDHRIAMAFGVTGLRRAPPDRPIPGSGGHDVDVPSAPVVPRTQVLYDQVVMVPLQRAGLAAHPGGVHAHHAVDHRPGFAPVPVPVAVADVDPVARVVMLLARQLDRQQGAGLLPGHDEHRAVLAPAVVLLVRDPGPHDLARVRVAVVVRCVSGVHGADHHRVDLHRRVRAVAARGVRERVVRASQFRHAHTLASRRAARRRTPIPALCPQSPMIVPWYGIRARMQTPERGGYAVRSRGEAAGSALGCTSGRYPAAKAAVIAGGVSSSAAAPGGAASAGP
jgi:EPSP synthase (3-phosphoshikimate 1-carboxyvinyltransferase)